MKYYVVKTMRQASWLINEGFEKIKEQLFSFGIKIPQIESEIYQTLFSITAELSDILSVQSLMRDFGILKK